VHYAIPFRKLSFSRKIRNETPFRSVPEIIPTPVHFAVTCCWAAVLQFR